MMLVRITGKFPEGGTLDTYIGVEDAVREREALKLAVQYARRQWAEAQPFTVAVSPVGCYAVLNVAQETKRVVAR